MALQLPSLPNTNVRSRATGICERSGLGIIVAGTRLVVRRRAGFTHDAELEEAADARIVRFARQRFAIDRFFLRPSAPSVVLAQVDEVQLVVEPIVREVDDDVVALGDALLVESTSAVTGVRQQVAVVGDLRDRLRLPEAFASAILKKRDDAGVQDAEAVLPALDFEVRLVGEVRRHHVAEEAVEVEDVEGQLAVARRTPCRRASG